MVMEAMRREPFPYGPRSLEPIILGVDVARFGNANSVVCARQGRNILEFVSHKGQDTMKTVDLVLMMMARYRTRLIAVDGGGVGGGVIDRLRQLGITVVEVQFGSAATPHLAQANREKARYANKRAEIWGSFRDWLRGGALPDDPQLLEALSGVKQKIKAEDVIQLEPKEVATDRMEKEGIVFDMDKADAAAITFAIDSAWYTGVGALHHNEHNTLPPPEDNPYQGFREPPPSVH
jgi:hypothetical protein